MAVKCDNCDKNALYTNSDPGVNSVNYCDSCLPYWLQVRAEAGQFPLVEPVKEKPEKPKAPKKDEEKTA